MKKSNDVKRRVFNLVMHLSVILLESLTWNPTFKINRRAI